MRSLPALLVVVSASIFATAAVAGSPAMIGPADPAATRAEASFSSFAGDWMERAIARGERDRKAPRAQTSSAGMVFTYRGVAEGFETELRPTVRPASPYVGVLRYTEQTFTCNDVQGSRCRVTSSLPVTELFRYRGGRWSY